MIIAPSLSRVLSVSPMLSAYAHFACANSPMQSKEPGRLAFHIKEYDRSLLA
jgi:hypothetical protein